MIGFQEKHALITGGSSGIGLAVAHRLAALGAHVTILARDPMKLATAADSINAARISTNQKVKILQADVSNTEQILDIIPTFIAANQSIDYLINSAGVARPGEFENFDIQLFRWMMEINFMGTVNTTKAVLPDMIKRKSGHIINISSMVGYLGMYGYTAYASTKFAIKGFTDSLRPELKPYGIKLSIVFPPDTETPQLEEENKYKPPLLAKMDEAAPAMKAEEVANSIVTGISRGSYIITPGFSSTIFFKLVGLLGGGAVYPLLDFMVDDARRKVNKK